MSVITLDSGINIYAAETTLSSDGMSLSTLVRAYGMHGATRVDVHFLVAGVPDGGWDATSVAYTVPRDAALLAIGYAV